MKAVIEEVLSDVLCNSLEVTSLADALVTNEAPRCHRNGIAVINEMAKSKSNPEQDTVESIGKHLEALTPRSLDDIFRLNRDQGTVALASKKQLMPLMTSVPDRVAIRGDITDWRFIAVTVDMPDRGFWQERIYLLGAVGGESWITSAVENIDLERKLVRTRNSVYRLVGDQAQGEPDSYGLIYICGAFNTWGLGPLFGVPEIFF